MSTSIRSCTINTLAFPKIKKMLQCTAPKCLNIRLVLWLMTNWVHWPWAMNFNDVTVATKLHCTVEMNSILSPRLSFHFVVNRLAICLTQFCSQIIQIRILRRCLRSQRIAIKVSELVCYCHSIIWCPSVHITSVRLFKFLLLHHGT